MPSNRKEREKEKEKNKTPTRLVVLQHVVERAALAVFEYQARGVLAEACMRWVAYV